MIIKGMNAAKKKEELAAPVAAPEPSNQEKLLMEIRDALKK
jgi:large conductance mechanosensitive channel